MIYRIIDQRDNAVIVKESADGVALFLLGLVVQNYLIVKSDGDKYSAFVLKSREYNKIIEELEAA
jgi:hypothetical protein